MRFKQKLFYSHYIAGIVVLFLFTAVFAQKNDTADRNCLESLSDVTVSATRLDIQPEKLPQKIEVITQQDLDMTVADDITDVLKKNASIDVIQYPGILGGVGIRGFRPEYSGINQKTLTLFDGRVAGATNLATMQVYNIERIEIVKGPVSAVYGPQAMGGVVNIIPKRSVGDISTQVKLKYGSFESAEAVLHSGGSLFDHLNYDLSAAVFNRGKDFRIGSRYILSKLSEEKFDGKAERLYTDGHTEKVENLGDGLTRHYTKYDKQNFSLRLGTDLLGDRIAIDLRGEMFGADGVESPGDIAYGDRSPGFKNVSRNDEQFTLKGDFGKHKFKVLQYYAKEYSDRFKGFGYGDTMYQYYASGADFFGVQCKYDLEITLSELVKIIASPGVDYDWARAWSQKWELDGEEIAPYSPNSLQSDLGGYAQGFIDLKDGLFTSTVGFRFDRITLDLERQKKNFFADYTFKEASFTVFSPSVGLSFAFSKLFTSEFITSLYSNVGKGFTAPSAGYLAGWNYSDPDGNGNVQLLRGNSDLDPEQNISVDGGIRFMFDNVGVKGLLGGYYTFVENAVTSVVRNTSGSYKGNPVTTVKTYENVSDKTRMAGLEWEFDFNILKPFDLSQEFSVFTNGHAVLLSEVPEGDDTTEVDNVRNPNFVFGLNFYYPKRLSARLSARWMGKQRDTDWTATYPYPDIRYPHFLVTDFVVRVHINEHHSAGVSVSNITDENYYEKRGYNLPGRSFALDYALLF